MTITHKGHPLFFVDQLSSHTWLPRRGLSSSLMCPPRPPTVAATAPWPASSRWLSATAPQPAVPPPQRPGQQCLRHGAPASNTSATVHRPLPPRRPGQQRPASNISAATAPRPASSRWRSATAHGQQCLRHGAPASSTSATVPRPAAPPPRRLGRCSQRSCRQLLPDAAALSSMQGPPRSGNFSAQTSASLHPSRSASLAGPLPFTRGMGAHGLCGRVPDSAGNVSPWIAAAQTDANLSAHLHRLPTPPPYLRQMRLSHGRVRGCWVLDETFASQGLRCWVQMMLLVVRGAVPANHRAHESLF